MAKKNIEDVVEIKNVNYGLLPFRIVGDSPLLVHHWSAKNKSMLNAAQVEESTNKKKDISKKKEYPSRMESFIESMYWIKGKPTKYTEKAFDESVENGAEWGFKAEAFKAAAMRGAMAKKWIKDKVNHYGIFYVEADCIDAEQNQLVRIKGDTPVCNEAIVRLGGQSRVPDIRWRGMFLNWYVDIVVKYDVDGVFSAQDILNIFNAGGSYAGVGEYRPEKGGQYGMFHVEPLDSLPGKS